MYDTLSLVQGDCQGDSGQGEGLRLVASNQVMNQTLVSGKSS
ncbi:MAG: hypothetical protein ACL7AX_13250 [Candidatus Arsenophonus phytopathogenicus]